jgi:CHAD domain-containing protein
MKASDAHRDEKPPPFRFRDGESVRDGVRRIARHELERILEGLDKRPGTEDSIHEIRKGTKRLRALLRLVRDAIGEKNYRRENRAFRDIGRAFASARDAEVAEKSLEKLGADLRRGLAPRTLGSLRHALHARTREAHEAAKNGRVAADIRRAVRKALVRLDRWSHVPDKWSAVRGGLERIQSLEPIWPEVVQALAREVERLESDLGEDHDLAMLPAHVARDGVCPSEHDRELVIALVDVRRRALQARARRPPPGSARRSHACSATGWEFTGRRGGARRAKARVRRSSRVAVTPSSWALAENVIRRLA